MNKILALLFAALLILPSCDQTKKITGTFPEDVKIFFMIGENRDSVFVKDGKFELDIPVDSVSLGIFYINRSYTKPIFFYCEPNSFEINVIENEKNPGVYTFSDVTYKNAPHASLFNRYMTVGTGGFKSNNKIYEYRLQQYIKIAKSNPTSFITYSVLNSTQLVPSGFGNVKLMNQLLSILKNANPEKNFSNLEQNIAAVKSRSTGMLPQMRLNDVNGTEISVNDYLSTYTLIDMWASWCGPCRKDIPNVKEAYKQYKDKGFSVIAISIDKSKEKWLEAVEQEKIYDFINLNKAELFQDELAEFGLDAIPDNFLVDQNGKIIANTLRGEQLHEKLEELLGE